MDEYVAQLIENVKALKEAEADELNAEAKQKDAEAIASVQELLPKELRQYVTILNGEPVLFAPECGPIGVMESQLKYDEEPITRYIVRNAKRYDAEPFWSDKWTNTYTDLGTALYNASLEYQSMQKLTAEWEAKQAEYVARPDYLALASEMSKSPDEVLGGIAAALCGILEYLRNREE